MKKIDNPLRIKVTGVCNRDCSFCHHEGGDNRIEEIGPSLSLGYDIKKLCQKLNIELSIMEKTKKLLNRK